MKKSNKSSKFLKLVGEHREQKKKEKFRGTLGEYLELIEKDTGITKLAHKRLFDSISSHGITKMKTSNERCNKLFNADELRTYDYFQDKFFGMERSKINRGLFKYKSSFEMVGCCAPVATISTSAWAISLWMSA